MPRFSNQKMMPLSVSYENCYDFGFCEKVFQTTASRNFLLSTAKVFISSKKNLHGSKSESYLFYFVGSARSSFSLYLSDIHISLLKK